MTTNWQTNRPKGFGLVLVLMVAVLVIGGIFLVKQLRPGGRVQRNMWMQTAEGWEARGTISQCPDPLITFPVDLSLATSVLYPGQYRGNDYKPHGGFRFDDQETNEIKVIAPME